MSCCSCVWPLGGVQQQNGPNNDLIPKGTFADFFSIFLCTFCQCCSLTPLVLVLVRWRMLAVNLS